MPKGIPKKFYTGEFKQKVIETMHKEKLSYRESARRYNIPDHKMITNWERHYLEEGVEGLYLEHRGSAKQKRNSSLPKQVELDLIAEVQILRAENAYLKKLRALVQEEEAQERKHK